MGDVLTLFAAAGVLAAVLAAISLATPHRLTFKIVAIATIALFLPVSFVALNELLSRPKPVEVEWTKREVPDATVLAARMVENKAIYLWLKLKDRQDPRAYVLPWSDKLAKQLHRARREAGEKKGKLKMRNPFKPAKDDTKMTFYAEPQPPLPAKQAQEHAPRIFNR